MQGTDLLQAALYFLALTGAALLLGRWMAGILDNAKLTRFDTLLARLGGYRADEGMNWKRYLGAVLLFNAVGFIVLLALQLLQRSLPANPAGLDNVSLPLALNTAISFVTNTNWQAYSGEATMSYLTQMLGLGVQNFLSAATGIAVLLALVRGLRAKAAGSLGNAWLDLSRITLVILLPLAFILAFALVQQGVVQTFEPYAKAATLEGSEQVIPLGPAASQIAIKQLGTNGGGFFGVNSAHPFENPTPLTNFLEMLSILLLPAALVFTFGQMIGRKRDAWIIYGVMLALIIVGFVVAWWSEAHYALNLEGKETRFGVMNSVLWGTATTAASNGSVNAMHSSFSPLAGMIALLNIMLGEIIFGGVGSGLYGMMLFVIMTVFIAGLMVGRTPEYLGKKIEAKEMIWVVIGILAPGATMLLGGALACLTEAGRASLLHSGPHGLSEIFYAWASAAGNNGSAFAGLSANTLFYNYGLGLAMLIGRFAVIIPVMAIAGSLAMKKTAPPSLGTFPTNGPVFAVLLISVILIVGGLTFLPVLSLGPVLEHLMMK